jgi:hypothetical protein
MSSDAVGSADMEGRVRPGWVEFAGLAMISFVLSGVMSAFMTAFALGLKPGYPGAVLLGWGLGFVVSFPTAILVVPPVVRWQFRQNARKATKQGR